MPYAALEDLLERAGEAEMRQIADRDRDGTVDADVIQAALEDADNLIDGYVAVRYATPLASVPPIVLTWAVSIARYVLHRNGQPEHVVRDYKDAIAALKDVSAGRLALPVPAGAAEPAAQQGGVISAHPPQVFTPKKMRGWT